MINFIKLILVSQLFLACAVAPAMAKFLVDKDTDLSLVNSIDGEVFEDCEFGSECSYTPSKLDIHNLIESVKKSVGDVKAGIFTDKHHIDGKTYIEARDGIVHYSSESNECRLRIGKTTHKNLSCLDVIDYVLRKKDRDKIKKEVDTYEIILVIYKYDINKESGFRLGFGGTLDGNIENKPSRGSLAFNESQPLLSLFTANLGNLTSDLLSLNLNLGNLGGYLTTYRSFKLREVRANDSFNFGLEKESRIANSSVVGSTNSASEEVGLFFSGKIIPHRGEDSKVTIESGRLNYIRSTGEGASNSNSFSLTREINLSRGSSFQMVVDLNRPKMLFDINTVEIVKEKGLGLLFFNDKKISNHLNLIGVLHITKVVKGSGPVKSQPIVSASQFDFRSVFNDQTANVFYDPIISKVGINPANTSGKDQGSASAIKIKPYYLKLDPENIPVDQMGQKVVLRTTAESPVNIMAGSETASIRELVENGIYFGVEPKGGKINVAPLKFALQVTLDQVGFLNSNEWTAQGMSNQVVIDIVHYANKSTSDSISNRTREHNFIPWR